VLTRGLLCVHRMFALIRQVQQLACPGYPADSDWDGEISVSVSRPFRVRACSKVGLAQLPVYLTRPVASVFSRSAPRVARILSVRALLLSSTTSRATSRLESRAAPRWTSTRRTTLMQQLGTIRTSGESCVQLERLRALRPHVWRLPPLGMAPATSTTYAVTAVGAASSVDQADRNWPPTYKIFELASVHRMI